MSLEHSHKYAGQEAPKTDTALGVSSNASVPEENQEALPLANIVQDADQEVVAAHPVFSDPTVFRDAGMAAFNQYQASKHMVDLNLATHARFEPEDPLESGIVLADGVLTAREVLRHRLQADLLVLSACESGRVGFLGGEELAGLSQAFLQAGVRSLLVSLWKVNDPATAALMQAFYAARQAGADKAQALREAMTQIQRDPRWSHPYYWGAFTLVGDWD
nr:CHAT domain-containing protein [Ktedonobacter racemifer]